MILLILTLLLLTLLLSYDSNMPPTRHFSMNLYILPHHFLIRSINKPFFHTISTSGNHPESSLQPADKALMRNQNNLSMGQTHNTQQTIPQPPTLSRASSSSSSTTHNNIHSSPQSPQIHPNGGGMVNGMAQSSFHSPQHTNNYPGGNNPNPTSQAWGQSPQVLYSPVPLPNKHQQQQQQQSQQQQPQKQKSMHPSRAMLETDESLPRPHTVTSPIPLHLAGDILITTTTTTTTTHPVKISKPFQYILSRIPPQYHLSHSFAL